MTDFSHSVKRITAKSNQRKTTPMLKTTYKVTVRIAMIAGLLLATTGLHAADKAKTEKEGLAKARNTVDRVRLPDPPKVSTGTAKADPKEISKKENAKEKERSKEIAKKYPLDKTKVPS